MKSKFLKDRIELVKREMKDILWGWNAIDIFISKDEKRDYEYMTGVLEVALSMIEIHGAIVTGDNKEIPESCLTCIYNVKNPHFPPYWMCACVRSEYFTEHTYTGKFKGCSKWEGCE